MYVHKSIINLTKVFQNLTVCKGGSNYYMERDFKGVWIPKDIYLNTELNWTEKILLIEIDSLDGPNGCYASNEHFANHLMISKDRAGKLINKLVKQGYITSTLIYKTGTKQIEKRILHSTIGYRCKQLEGNGKNNYSPIGENDQDNNTSINNTINNTTTSNSNGDNNYRDKKEGSNKVNSSNEFKNLKLYNELGFGTINPTTASNILSLEEEYSEKWVELALKEADYNGSRKLSYVEGILRKWKITGVKSKTDKPKGEETKQKELSLEEQILEKVLDFDKNNKPIGIIKAIIYNWINLYSIDSIYAAIEQCKSEDNKTMKRVKEILEG